jgi:hypothetical protein
MNAQAGKKEFIPWADRICVVTMVVFTLAFLIM